MYIICVVILKGENRHFWGSGLVIKRVMLKYRVKINSLVGNSSVDPFHLDSHLFGQVFFLAYDEWIGHSVFPCDLKIVYFSCPLDGCLVLFKRICYAKKV